MKFCMVDTQIKKVLHLISDVTKKMSSSPTRPTSLPDKKMKKWHNFQNNCPIWLKFCMKLPLKVPCHWHQNKLGGKNSPPTARPAKNGACRDFFKKLKFLEKNLKNMITHDCLNVIIKNFALILIALLYLAKYISKRIDNNVFLGLICIQNELE